MDANDGGDGLISQLQVIKREAARADQFEQLMRSLDHLARLLDGIHRLLFYVGTMVFCLVVLVSVSLVVG